MLVEMSAYHILTGDPMMPMISPPIAPPSVMATKSSSMYRVSPANGAMRYTSAPIIIAFVNVKMMLIDSIWFDFSIFMKSATSFFMGIRGWVCLVAAGLNVATIMRLHMKSAESPKYPQYVSMKGRVPAHMIGTSMRVMYIAMLSNAVARVSMWWLAMFGRSAVLAVHSNAKAPPCMMATISMCHASMRFVISKIPNMSIEMDDAADPMMMISFLFIRFPSAPLTMDITIKASNIETARIIRGVFDPVICVMK